MFAGMEGTRPLLVEIQALVAPSPLGTPRRSVVGWDGNRLAMLLAVLEAHCGLRLGDCDVYLNVAGGLRIAEPAADLAVAAALVSSRVNVPLPADQVYFGEVSLSGAVRPVARMAARLKEARKLGFGAGVPPAGADDCRGGRDRDARRAGGRNPLISAGFGPISPVAVPAALLRLRGSSPCCDMVFLRADGRIVLPEAADSPIGHPNTA